jgi:GrpB-like predicted nucleotidyltransferase (UPF0157 family)
MRKIEVVPYDTSWPKMFEQESILIKSALGENCVDIHHIGSTSVPGLCAKPVIDMIPVVKDITLVDSVNEKMRAIGYEPQGEFGIPFRRYFQKGGDNRTHHVHVFEEGSSEIARHLAFRDWMRSHPDDMKAYGELKQECARQFAYDSLGYCNGKDAFIKKIDSLAYKDLSPRMMHVCLDYEWEEFHSLCVQLFDGKSGVTYDRNYPSFSNSNFFHFVLYVGFEIVSAAQLERLSSDDFVMRFLITKPTERQKGYGVAFVKLLEKWMRQQGAKRVKLHSSRTAEIFYRSLGYSDILFDDVSIDPLAVDLGKEL